VGIRSKLLSLIKPQAYSDVLNERVCMLSCLSTFTAGITVWLLLGSQYMCWNMGFAAGLALT